MEIRELRRDEILPALHLVWEVFIKDVAPSYTPEGIREFQKTIRYETILPMYMNREITMLGAFEGTELIGTISVKNVGHIFLFYVKSSCQGRGAGRQLFQAAVRYCAGQLRVSRITVNAAPGAVPKYIRMGMHPVMSEQMINGIRYTPMEMAVKRSVDYRQNTPKSDPDRVVKIILIGGAALVCVFLFFFLLSASVFFVISGRRDRPDDSYRHNYYDYYDYYGEYYDDGADAEEEEEEGLEAIPASIDSNLSYELGEEKYSFTDYEKQNTYIEFFIQYPKVDGIEGPMQDKVNQALKDCAMKSVEEIYEKPSDEIKEAVIEAEYPVITSYVKYKVCFASENLLSVAFEDYNYRGSMDEYHENFRTMNINLKDGTVYQVKDVVDINDGFADLWLQRIREGEAGERAFSELSRKEIKQTLSGDSLDGVYVVNFFLDEDGINIGYDLNYKEGDPNDAGYVWLTAVFEERELEEYIVDKEIWE